MIETILRDHLSRYPAMQIQDVYKLLHQAALGSEHAVSNSESARKWLTRELAEMGEGPTEPLFDPISPGGEIARVHLRPFIGAGHNPDVLLDAFICTANEYHGNVRQFEKFWQAVETTAIFPIDKTNEFFQSMKAQNFPAVHHSPEFEQLYRPAYRVVASTFCLRAWLD